MNLLIDIVGSLPEVKAIITYSLSSTGLQDGLSPDTPERYIGKNSLQKYLTEVDSSF